MLQGQMLHGQMLHEQILHGQMLQGQLLHGQIVLGNLSTLIITCPCCEHECGDLKDLNTNKYYGCPSAQITGRVKICQNKLGLSCAKLSTA